MEDKIKNPLDSLDHWEDDLLVRYPEKDKKAKEEYRDYDTSDRAEVLKNFYKLNHEHQTYNFVSKKEKEFLAFNKKEMFLSNAIDFLNTLVDDSDPDIELDQFQHLFQNSEAIRADRHEDWFVLTGFLHDLGKVLCLFGEPQWAVVGDTFPVGCEFSDKIVYPEFFSLNSDSKNPKYNTFLGIYSQNCGLDQVKMSWGHDEYLYQILKDHMPKPPLYMIRYHSFYAQHREAAYNNLMSTEDHELFKWVKEFNSCDLYSKAPTPKDSK